MHARYAFTIRVVASFIMAGPVQAAAPLGTVFSYQGQLKQSGSPVIGVADFQFSLWDAAGGGNPPTGGTQIGSTLTFDGASGNPASVAIADGLFTVNLDFGASAFNGEKRWLEIALRIPTGSGSYTTLNPRQRINATPYALETRGIVVDANNNVGVGVGTQTPLGPLQLGSQNNWKWTVGNGWGDFSVSALRTGLAIGVATTGGAVGDVRMWTQGGRSG